MNDLGGYLGVTANPSSCNDQVFIWDTEMRFHSQNTNYSTLKLLSSILFPLNPWRLQPTLNLCSLFLTILSVSMACKVTIDCTSVKMILMFLTSKLFNHIHTQKRSHSQVSARIRVSSQEGGRRARRIHYLFNPSNKVVHQNLWCCQLCICPLKMDGFVWIFN